MPKILGIIPSRFPSTRLPGKPLLKIGSQTMIQRVYNQAIKCSLLDEVFVATDHEGIFEHVIEFGGKVVMTSKNHQSGTDRCFEALTKIGNNYDYVINIQGDEPFIFPEQIDLLANLLDGNTELATLIKKIDDFKDLTNINTPKVVFNKKFEAMYFSRQTIPYIRDENVSNWLNTNMFYKHIGIYGYRTDILEKITKLAQSDLELAEKLEQNRWIENGYKIKVAISPYDSIGIDTNEDIEAARVKISQNIG
jgi:3-deoxy-manno-octulosonate cytidylyltransferase (CMP-KDO synthetase)